MPRGTKSEQTCCVVGCTNSYSSMDKAGEGIQFHRFPSRPHQLERRKVWICAVRRQRCDGSEAWAPKANTRICSRHFVGNRKSEDPSSPSYNPSMFPSAYRKRPPPSTSQDRYERLAQ
ncbi:THAP domain-containing protein 6-like isoform X2 [Dermacentor silvarum]|uniref:THAP domain-containing protein 6-like isoform X2 n=1 Tax=Dermacentor silvarum TaxID=543639 RepID=UPI002100DD81|nr:THAP domain-containing protein 6-like isoform X2 [Dermacentor silvarum]